MIEADSLEQTANALSGNWQKFPCFCWARRFEDDDPGNWCVVYTHHRDSRLVEQSNAAVIDRVMAPFTEGDNPDAVCERHSHWACGWLDGYAIRVWRDGQITPTFRAWYDLAERRNSCGLLDGDDYTEREHEATLANIRSEGRIGSPAWARTRALFNPEQLPADWAEQVYDWLADNNPGTVENHDDCGGYPTREKIAEALRALGLAQSQAGANIAKGRELG